MKQQHNSKIFKKINMFQKLHHWITTIPQLNITQQRLAQPSFWQHWHTWSETHYISKFSAYSQPTVLFGSEMDILRIPCEHNGTNIRDILQSLRLNVEFWSTEWDINSWTELLWTDLYWIQQSCSWKNRQGLPESSRFHCFECFLCTGIIEETSCKCQMPEQKSWSLSFDVECLRLQVSL